MYEMKHEFTIGELVLLAQKLCAQINLSTSYLDARILLAHVLEKSAEQMYWQKNIPVHKQDQNKFLNLLARRLCFEPIAYITKYKEFYGRNFFVTSDCLIPRPDTECVVEQALNFIAPEKKYVIFDIGTGSGAIGCTILVERPQCVGYLSDIDSKALKIAEQNGQNLGVGDRAQFLLGDLFACFDKSMQADIIISNPPYIAPEKISQLMPDVRDFEPYHALNGFKPHGMSFYYGLIRQAPEFLKPNGKLILEIGFDQREKIKKLVSCDDRWLELDYFQDLSGLTRGVVLELISRI